MSESTAFGLPETKARAIVVDIVKTVDGWKELELDEAPPRPKVVKRG